MIVILKTAFEYDGNGDAVVRYDTAALVPAGLNIVGRDGLTYILPFENVLVMQNPDSLPDESDDGSN